MKISLFLIMLSVLVWGGSAPYVVHANASLPQISISGQDILTVKLTQGGVTTMLPVSSQFMNDIDGLYDEVYVKDLDGNGIDEVIFQMAQGSINSCLRVLKYDAVDGLLHELKFAGAGLCNIKEEMGHLVSSYRAGGAWVQDVYDFVDGNPRLIVSDACIGCSEVQRRELTSSGSYTQLLVSNGESYKERKPLAGKIRSVKASIYASPLTSAVTRKYLVRGDEIAILGYQQSDELWVKFRYVASTPTEGWIKCSDVERSNVC
jgi:hypothetical protein